MSEKLNYTNAIDMCVMSIKSGRTALLLGPPGCGKTAMAKHIYNRTRDMLEGFAFVALNDYSPEEFGGIPAPIQGKDEYRRLTDPTGPLHIACSVPTLIVFDEFAACDNRAMFTQARRIMHDRRLGNVPLHEGTRFVAFSNPQAMSLMANDLPLPVLNAMNILNLEYEVSDFQEWLDHTFTSGEEEKYAKQLSGFLDVRPNLLEIDPSKIVGGEGGTDQNYCDQIASRNENWASPRSWEGVVRMQATMEREHYKPQGELFTTLLTGIVGPRAASQYVNLLSVCHMLPKASEISESPTTAKLPPDFPTALSLAGTLQAVRDSAAAWTYIVRLQGAFMGGEEVMAGLVCVLERKHPINKAYASPFTAAALQAQIALTAKRERVKRGAK